MDWIIQLLRKTFGNPLANAIGLILIGIVLACGVPKVFVTCKVFGEGMSAIQKQFQRGDISNQLALLSFQISQLLQQKWSLESQIDQQGCMASARQLGRLDEIKSDLERLQREKTRLDSENKALK